jgi:hypothetical protein
MGRAKVHEMAILVTILSILGDTKVQLQIINLTLTDSTINAYTTYNFAIQLQSNDNRIAIVFPFDLPSNMVCLDTTTEQPYVC